METDYVIGVNWEQNSTAALFKNGTCLGALSNERLTRKKNDEAYPKEAIDNLLCAFNIKASDLSNVVFVSNNWSPAWILARHYTSFSVDDYLREQNEFWKPKIYKNKLVSIFDVFNDKLDLGQFHGTVLGRKT